MLFALHIPIGVLATIPVLPIIAYFLALQIWAVKVSRQAATKTAPLSAAETAKQVLHSGGATEIPVEKWDDFSDSIYDSEQKKLFLSPKIHDEANLLSVGTALQKAGHALLDTHQTNTLSTWKLTMILYTACFWIVAFTLPAGFVTSSVPAIVFSYVLLAVSFVLYFFNASIERKMHAGVLEQLGGNKHFDSSSVSEVGRVLRAISLMW